MRANSLLLLLEQHALSLLGLFMYKNIMFIFGSSFITTNRKLHTMNIDFLKLYMQIKLNKNISYDAI